MKISRRILYAFAALSLIVALSSCEMLSVVGLEGNVTLFVTDAKVDQSIVSGVYVTITGIAYNRTNGENTGWHDVEDFGDPFLINLMDFSDGEVEELNAFTLPMGNYSQLRFYIDALEIGDPVPSELKSFIKFDDGTMTWSAPLYVTNREAGFKAVGGFSVPFGGDVSLIADFDLRKSVVVANGIHKLKPVIRLLDQDDTGSIEGHVYGSGKHHTVIVHVYKKDKYKTKEAKDPKKEEPRFPNAVSSAKVGKMIDGDDSDSEYVLPFLDPDEYDLIVTSYDEDGNFIGVESDTKTEYKGVRVEKKEKARENLFLQILVKS